jgi:hypothetical protein
MSRHEKPGTRAGLIANIFQEPRIGTSTGKSPLASVHFVTQEPRMNTAWIYVDTSKQVGDADHIKVFANPDAAEKWFEENDPAGVAFEYEVLE